MNAIRIRTSLVAAAALAVCGLASAQSAQLFGVVDVAVQRGTGSVANKTQLGNSGLTTSRLGFRGTEDLGGGQWAGFWLEAGVNPDNGTGSPTNTNNQASGSTSSTQGLTFNRRSTLSLGGSWGELRVGRDFTPQYHNLSAYEPTGGSGVGTAVNSTNIITGPTNTRASNAISDFMPTTKGFFGQAQYYMGENASNVPNKNDGNGGGIRVGYQGSRYEIAAATSKTKYAGGNSKQSNIGGFYDFGVAKLLANYSRDEGLVQLPSNGGQQLGKGRGFSLGTSVPYGSSELRAGYSRYQVEDVHGAGLDEPTAKKVMASWVYNLSKRTAMYGTVARVTNSGGSSTALLGSATAANDHSNGYEAGIRHAF